MCIHILQPKKIILLFGLLNGDKNSAPIIFYEIGYPLINSNKKITFNFKPGMLLIFPGFMPHEVAINKSNNRLIISGNAI